MFIQVVREVNMAKEYMDWLVEESGDSKITDVSAEDAEAVAVAVDGSV